MMLIRYSIIVTGDGKHWQWIVKRGPWEQESGFAISEQAAFYTACDFISRQRGYDRMAA
jgi:hypothetical protein